MRRIVVPVDGTPFAEAALAPACRIALTRGAELHLVKVEPITDTPATGNGGGRDAGNRPGRELDLLAEKLRSRFDTAIVTAAARGPVAAALAQYAAGAGAELIVMATHGRTGVGRVLAGSVADDLLHLTSVPLMLLRVGADGDARTGPPRRILVALDGSPAGQQGLLVAAALARENAAHLLLVHVVVPIPVDVNPAAGLGATLTDMVATQRLIDSAHDDLERIAVELRARDGIEVDLAVEVGEAVSTMGVAGRVIARLAVERRIDLVVLTSRERRGSRLLMRSVADRLLHDTDCAVLLCHAPQPEPHPFRRAMAAQAS